MWFWPSSFQQAKLLTELLGNSKWHEVCIFRHKTVTACKGTVYHPVNSLYNTSQQVVFQTGLHWASASVTRGLLWFARGRPVWLERRHQSTRAGPISPCAVGPFHKHACVVQDSSFWAVPNKHKLSTLWTTDHQYPLVLYHSYPVCMPLSSLSSNH